MNTSMMLAGTARDFWGWVAYLLQVGGNDYLLGAGKTLLIAAIGTAIGCIIGFLVGIVQTIPIEHRDPMVKKVFLRVIRGILSVYIEVFRGTPMMVQAMVIFFGSMAMFGIDMTPMVAGFVIVSINTGAYMSESVRGGIYSIDKGQTEAAKAIGMTHFQTMASVIFPQALRNLLPQIGNNLIINIKDTSVLSVITVTELFFSTKSLAGTYYQYFPAFSITCVIYLIMTFTCSRILRWYEKKLDGPESFNLAGANGAEQKDKNMRRGLTMQMFSREPSRQRSAIR